jgi:hypothetical protein
LVAAASPRDATTPRARTAAKTPHRALRLNKSVAFNRNAKCHLAESLAS